MSPIPAGSRSAPERARHAAELMKLRVMEHCNLLGLGVNPNLVRHAFARLFKPCCAPLCCAVPRVVAARAHVYFSRDSRHGAAAILQIKAALHKDTVSGGAVRTLLGRNVVLGTTVPEDSERGDELLDDEIKRLVKGKYGTLVTDGATFRHWKVIVVLFVSPQLEEPVLVSVIVPEAGVGVAEGARAGEDGADDEEEDTRTAHPRARWTCVHA